MKFSSEKPPFLITLRSVRLSDAAFLLRMENDPSVWSYSSQSEAPYTLDQIEQFCLAMEATATLPDPSGQLRLIVEHNMQVIGAVDFYSYCKESRTASIAIIIYPASQRGRHYGASALSQAVTFARTLGVEYLTAEITPSNEQSRSLFSGCGFHQSRVAPDGTLIYQL